MQLSRRQFLAGSVASVVAASLPLPSQSALTVADLARAKAYLEANSVRPLGGDFVLCIHPRYVRDLMQPIAYIDLDPDELLEDGDVLPLGDLSLPVGKLGHVEGVTWYWQWIAR